MNITSMNIMRPVNLIIAAVEVITIRHMSTMTAAVDATTTSIMITMVVAAVMSMAPMSAVSWRFVPA